MFTNVQHIRDVRFFSKSNQKNDSTRFLIENEADEVLEIGAVTRIEDNDVGSFDLKGTESTFLLFD